MNVSARTSSLVPGAIGLVLAWCCAPAVAQQAPAARSNVLDEVLVTARRREESLQTVPLAVTAMKTEQLEQRGVENMVNLNILVPNVLIEGSFLSGVNGGSLRARGILGVLIYVDGVPQEGTGVGTLLDVVDLERVEVLRGPQGTLFGRNAIGGAIQYITALPKDKFGGSMKATVGSFNRVDLVGSVDVPISDTLLTKVSVAKQTRGGYVDSTTIAGYSYGSQDDTTVRLQGLWRPNDTFSARLIGEYLKSQSNGAASILFGVSPCLTNPPPLGVFQCPNSTGLYGAIGQPFTAQEQYAQSKEWKTSMDWTGPGSGNEKYAVTADLNWKLSEDWALRSITGYRNMETYSYSDNDATNKDLFQVWLYNQIESTSEELQLLFSGTRFTGTVGAFYQNNRNSVNPSRYQESDLQAGAALAAVNAYCASAGCPPYAGGYFSSPNDPSVTATKQWALFSEWTYHITDKLSATAGLRYTDVKVDANNYVSGDPHFLGLTNNGGNIWDAYGRPCCDPYYVYRHGVLKVGGSTSAKNTATTPRVSVQYQFTPDIMAYATYAEGFNAGGVNTLSIPSIGVQFTEYKPETLKNYEVGMRADLFDKRLRMNLTLFKGTWSNVQITEDVKEKYGLATQINEITNAGEAKIQGVELEGVVRVTDAFSIDYAYGHLKTEYTKVGTSDIQIGTPFVNSPANSYSLGLQYDLPVKGGGDVNFRTDYGWKDKYVFARYNFIPQDALFWQKSYGLLGGRVTYTSASGMWSTALYGSNLTNEFYSVGGFVIPGNNLVTGSYGRPREGGVTFNVNF